MDEQPRVNEAKINKVKIIHTSENSITRANQNN